MADNPFAKNPYVIDDTQKIDPTNPFLQTGKVAMKKGGEALEVIKDVGWQGLQGLAEGALKLPGALAGDLPALLVHGAASTADRLRRLNAEDQGKEAPKKLARQDMGQYLKDLPWGSQNTRELMSTKLGAPRPVKAKTTLGKYVGAGAEFVPSAVLGGGPLRAFTAGVGSQLGMDMFPDSGVAPIAGAVLGHNAPGIFRAGGRAMIPNMDPRDIPAASHLMRHGVPVYPGQLSSNPLINNIYDLSKSLSVMGDRGGIRQQEAFTRAAGRTAGVNAPELSQATLDSATRNIVQRMDDIFSQTTVRDDPQLMRLLANIETTSSRALQPAQRGYITSALNEITNALARAPRSVGVPGTEYWNMIKRGSVSAINNALNSDDPTVAAIARQLKQGLEQSLERNAPVAFRDPIRQARSQYANLKTIEPMALKSGEDAVTATGLLNRVVNEQGNVRGPLGQLAKAGKRLLQPPKSSGSIERSGALGWLAALGTSIPTAVATASFGPAALTLGGTLALPMGTKALLERQWLTNMMMQKAARGMGAGAGPRPGLRPPAPLGVLAQGVTGPHAGILSPQWTSGGLLP